MLTSISNTRAFPLLLVLFGLFLSLSCCPVFAASKYFADITDEIGLDFRHVNGFSTERRFVEMVGSGGAFFDYDNDDDIDLYLVQGNYLPQPHTGLTNKLYRNDGHHLTDVTKALGLDNNQYGIGVIVGDYDGDGCRDLYLTNFGSNVLCRNDGDGTFTDVT